MCVKASSRHIDEMDLRFREVVKKGRSNNLTVKSTIKSWNETTF